MLIAFALCYTNTRPDTSAAVSDLLLKYVLVMRFAFVIFALTEGGTTQVHKFKQGRLNFRLAVILYKRHQFWEINID